MSVILFNVNNSHILWDQFIISTDRFLYLTENVEKIGGNIMCPMCKTGRRIITPPHVNNSSIIMNNSKMCLCTHKNIKVSMNGYLLSVFVNALQTSLYYRCNVIRNFIKMNKKMKSRQHQVSIILKEPNQDIIDYSWNERMEKQMIIQKELNHAMSWLSTLGGAFSALGDEYVHCAEMAGYISLQQLKIALQLGDPLTVVQCKLYVALSLLQRGYLQRSRRIIEQQYEVAKAFRGVDMRLVRMCLGIWAKLKYMHTLKRDIRQMPTVSHQK